MNSYNGFSPAQRNRAQAWLRQQWAAGKIPRPKVCCACGQDKGVIDAHAEDYSEPFGPHLCDYPLCFRCHVMLHCRFKATAAFLRYADEVRQGKRYEPLFTRNFGAVRSQMAGAPVSFTQHEPRPGGLIQELAEKMAVSYALSAETAQTMPDATNDQAMIEAIAEIVADAALRKINERKRDAAPELSPKSGSAPQ